MVGSLESYGGRLVLLGVVWKDRKLMNWKRPLGDRGTDRSYWQPRTQLVLVVVFPWNKVVRVIVVGQLAKDWLNLGEGCCRCWLFFQQGFGVQFNVGFGLGGYFSLNNFCDGVGVERVRAGGNLGPIV